MAQHWVAPGFDGIDGIEFVDYEVPAPRRGEVTIEVRAAGVGPADWKYISPEFAHASAKTSFPSTIGSEISGVITALGAGTQIASGRGAVGDEVLAFRLRDGFATALTVPAKDVFAKPAALSFAEAAGLLAVGVTAVDMIRVTGVEAGQTALVHGASGSVGVLLLQLLRELGVKTVGTASPKNRSVVEGFGGTWVAYGDGLADRVRTIGAVNTAFDCVGTDEAIDVSVELLDESNAGTERFVTIANSKRARAEGLTFIAGSIPHHAVFRDSVRAELIAKAAAGGLSLPLGRSFPFTEAKEALRLLKEGHPSGKLTLVSRER